MKFTVFTLFPEIAEVYFNHSIMKRAVNKELIDYKIINFRDFAIDKHKKCDDYPYGGGAGLILKPEPLGAALDSIDLKDKRVIYPSPSGKIFTQKYAKELAKERDLVFICGRYEGLDQRIIDIYVNDEISIGDYVLSSGDIAAVAIIDAVYRHIEGVISKESLSEESFENDLLEYPQYTRPEVFKGLKVPEILLSGNHKLINEWRLNESRKKTLKNRPDLA